MKEAPVSRITWNPVAAVPKSIDFRRQPCSTSVSISTTSASRSASSARPGLRPHPEVRRGASQRRGIEWERPNTFAWCSAKADDTEGMSGKSRHRLAPVLTEASFMDIRPKRATRFVGLGEDLNGEGILFASSVGRFLRGRPRVPGVARLRWE